MNDMNHYLVLDVPNNPEKLKNIINDECCNNENVEKINHFFKKCEEKNEKLVEKTVDIIKTETVKLSENEEVNNTTKENIDNLIEENINKSFKEDIIIKNENEIKDNNIGLNEELDKTILIKKMTKTDVSEKISNIFKNIFPFRGTKN